MLSHEAPRVAEGELTLPKRGMCASSIAQAIASEQGEVVYEVLSRKEKESQVLLKYRAMPAREWKQFKNLPRHRWPLVPQEIKSKDISTFSDRLEFLLLGILGITLTLAIAWQSFEISRISSYNHRIAAMEPTTPVKPMTAPVRVQESWVSQLNQLTQQLSAAQARLTRFEFSQGKLLITVDSVPSSFDRVRAILRQVSGKEPLYLTGGHWQW